MSNRDIKALAHFSESAKAMHDSAGERLAISARSYVKAIKVARTIADLTGSPTIDTAHIAEALQYRRCEQALRL